MNGHAACAAHVGLLVAFATVTARIAAQDTGAAFDVARAAAETVATSGAAPADVQRAFAAAVDAYLRIPPDDVAAQSRRRAAAECAHRAARPALAAKWLRAEWEASGDAAVVTMLVANAMLSGTGLDALLEAHSLADRAGAEVRAGLVEAWVPTAESADRALRARRTELGLWAFGELVVGSGRNPIALANQALALRRVGRIDDAVAAYDEALQKSPTDALLWNDLGLLWKGAGRRDAAIDAFRKSAAVEDDIADGAAPANLAALGVGLTSASRVEAITLVTTVLRKRPDAGGGFARRVLLDLLLDGRDV